MNVAHSTYTYLLFVAAALFVSSCGTSVPVLHPSEMERSSVSAEEILARLPDYRETLHTVSGNGRAIVSEPNNNERVAIQFQSSRQESLLAIRNSLGIEGGQIYVDGDSLLIYNRIDRYAEKVPLHESRLTSVGSIASINILDLLNFTVNAEQISSVYENNSHFALVMGNDSYINIRRDSYELSEVVHAKNSQFPYSRIEYEGYSDVNGFKLPRRITVYSRDGESRAALLVQRIETNIELPGLFINIPEDIPIFR